LKERLLVLKERLLVLRKRLLVLKERLLVLKKRLLVLKERLLVLKERLLHYKKRLLHLEKRLFHLKMTLPVERKRASVFDVSLPLGSEHRPRDKKPVPVDAKRRLQGYPAPVLSSLLLLLEGESRGSPPSSLE
jgi:hypothetical protein